MRYVLLIYCFIITFANAESLPNHNEINILILSDEVNPHGLTDEELTQPNDLSVALQNAVSLNATTITEIPTNQIQLATSALLLRPLTYDALIYFAHRIPNNANQDQIRQEEFVTAVEEYLQAGGAVISFHHGIYQTTGKQSMQNLLGAQATGAVPWDTLNGQDVIFVGGNHFIGTNNINYMSQVFYENSEHSIPAASYPTFNNSPDELYPQLDFNSGVIDCNIQILFESDYVNNGANHLLGYLKYCPNWNSQLFVYQPGEYQPNALSGNNFQILLNAIYHLTEFRWDVVFANPFE